MATKAGMHSNPLARRTTPKTAGSTAGNVIAAMQAQAAPQAIPLDDIAYHPDNPAERLADIDQLADSIRQVGVITPITVVTLEAFTAVRTDLTDHPSLAGKTWVALAGHRRHAASMQAGKTDIPAYIRRDDVAAVVDTAILHENLHRLEISPIVEARSYQHAMERQGLSQRQLATHAALPQSQISKRLALLTLPESLQARITSGDLALGDAATLAAATPEARERVANLVEEAGTAARAVHLLHQAEQQLAREAREAIATARAEAEGAKAVLDANNRWSWAEEQNRRLTTKAEIAKARKEGTLAVAPASGGADPEDVRYYTTAPATTPKANPHEEAERAEAREQKKARQARRAHLLERASRPPAAGKMHDLVTDTVLNGLNLNADVAKIAMPLTYAADLTTTDPSAPQNSWDWRKEIPTLTGKNALHAAWLIALADLEFAASYIHTPWGARQVAYLDLLIAGGYSPTPWETDRLTRARNQA